MCRNESTKFCANNDERRRGLFPNSANLAVSVGQVITALVIRTVFLTSIMVIVFAFSDDCNEATFALIVAFVALTSERSVSTLVLSATMAEQSHGEDGDGDVEGVV